MRRIGSRHGGRWALLLALVPALLGTGCGDPDAQTARPLRTAYDAHGNALFEIERPEGPPNLVLVVIDALRHDALRLDEEPRRDAPMPYLASLARQGAVFSNAVAAAPWTLPSMTSLLTGLQPSAHGLTAPDPQVRLVDAIATWAEVLRASYDYETVACVAGPWFLGSGGSILQGFERREVEFSLRDGPRMLRRWALERDAERPFFLLLHTYDAHDPYGEANHPYRGAALAAARSDPTLVGPDADPAEIFRRTFLDAGVGLALDDALGRMALTRTLHRYAQSGYAADPRPDVAGDLARAYWGGVRWTDGLLGRTLNVLGTQGCLRDTLLVVTSDHGEAFGDHGTLAHGGVLYDELVRVPLVMTGPAPFDRAQTVTSSIGLVDVLPTFFDWAGLEPLPGVEGRSRLALLDTDDDCRPVLSEERLGFLNTGDPVDAIRLSARTEHWKYIVTYDLQRGATYEEIYDLLLDPHEQDDLGGGTGRIPPELVFDDCFCRAVETLRQRIWDRAGPVDVDAAHIAYGTSNRRPSAPAPTPCRGGRD